MNLTNSAEKALRLSIEKNLRTRQWEERGEHTQLQRVYNGAYGLRLCYGGYGKLHCVEVLREGVPLMYVHGGFIFREMKKRAKAWRKRASEAIATDFCAELEQSDD